MTDAKQPLLDGSAVPPPYNPNSNTLPYPTGGGGVPPPAYHPAYPPPPQPAYGTTQTNTNVTVVQARPIATQNILIEAKPPNYILLSIIVLFAFCWVFGLIALIMAMQVDSAWASGDRDNARRLSATARGWNIAGMIVGAVVYVLIIISAIGSAAAD